MLSQPFYDLSFGKGFGRVRACLLALLFGLTGPLAAGQGNSSTAPSSATAKVDFNRDIRPILSENCFLCHGPDEGRRKAKLRFDRKDDAFKALKDGSFAIVPGHPEQSQMMARTSSTNQEEVMPPVKSGKRLTPQQIESLRQWIADGAVWKTHWAYVAPNHPPLPEVKNRKWTRNGIDAFVLARLEAEHLSPSPAADKTTLIRRVTLDLTGLPPTIGEVDAFVADNSREAYTKVVDRLLKSPRHGEHMARYWLDAVRYADTHGYHIDGPRDIWAYRDWVIHAFNNNMPFDQFTVEQLAGDLLPNATTDQRIASGYVRCNLSSNEGGAIESEFLAKSTFDRVETTATVWLGLTWTCARCHSHKYDPISQKEYYSLFAFFNSLDAPVFDSNSPRPDPYITLSTTEQTQRQTRLRKQIKENEADIEAATAKVDQDETAWRTEWHQTLKRGWTPLDVISAKSTNADATIKILADQSILAEGPGSESQEAVFKCNDGELMALQLEVMPTGGQTKTDGLQLAQFTAEIVLPGTGDTVQRLKFAQAAADISEDGHDADKAIDDNMDSSWRLGKDLASEIHYAIFRLAEPVKIEANSQLRVHLDRGVSTNHQAISHFRMAAAQSRSLVAALRATVLTPWQELGPLKNDSLQAGMDAVYEAEQKIEPDKTYAGAFEEIRWQNRPDFEDGRENALVSEIYSQKGNGVYYLSRVIKAAADCRAELSVRADDLFKIWVNGELIGARPVVEKPGDGPLHIGIHLHEGENKVLLKVVNYENKLCFFTFGIDLDQGNAPSADVATILAATACPAGGQQTAVHNYYRGHESPEFKQLQDAVAAWRYEDDAIEKTIATTMVAKEMDKPRETFLLTRGEYDKPGEPVTRDVPSFLPPLLKDQPTNRLGLARWIIDPGNPLTARVIVNRFWQQYFGVGLVKTAEDFGVQGEAPSHPELLDWLATEFVRNGWNVKQMQRLIVLSATYQQTSRTTPAARGIDPENRLLSRGPRFRVDAEVVRDDALFVSSLLVDQQGGPSVKPYQPPGLWEAVSHDNRARYVSATDQSQYRRSLYTYWKRQSPPPNMLLFDAPTRETCTVRRARACTPLQALDLLNDPQYVEASRAFAQRILLEGGKDDKDRIDYGMRLALARKPSSSETKVLEKVLNQELSRFRRDIAAADNYLKVGTFRPRGNLDERELAAWTTVASVVLNLDENITKN
jgi:mono/diheme cytochrome c family protein